MHTLSWKGGIFIGIMFLALFAFYSGIVVSPAVLLGLTVTSYFMIVEHANLSFVDYLVLI
jgi:hypothetical protein